MTWHSLLQTLREWRGRFLSRRDIAALEDRDIVDLGVNPGQLRFEAQKPFWRA
jgi:uncharacterized protein YjiS (DUF1127 family)